MEAQCVIPLTSSDRPARAWLRHFSKLLVVCTGFLVFKGALVTSHGAGLAVPDWPATFGENMFLYPPSKWVGGVYYEHVHRLLAAGVGFLTVVMALWVWLVDPRRWARLVGIGMVVAVIAQGVLGGMTVLYGLPAYVSSAHGILGQTFFALTCLMAYAQSQELENRLTDAEERSGDRRAFQCGLALLVLLYAQLTLGAFMRHTESGLALTDFPTFDGSLSLDFNAERLHEINQSRQQLGMVPVELYQVLLHAAHRIGGIVVFGAVLLLTLWAARRTVLSAQAKTAARFLWLLVCAQLMLGIFTVLSLRNPMLTSLHVAVGAVMIGMTLLFVMRSFPIVEEK